MRLLSSQEMKNVEACAARFGLSYGRMMENAGASCARYIRSVVEKDSRPLRNVAVVCGKGNNGGDGFVIARKLYESGYNVSIIHVLGYPSGADSEFVYKMAQDMGIRSVWLDADKSRCLQLIRSADVIVDAVFGFSFYGSIEGELCEVFNEINAASGTVFSIDLPSGTYCDSGYCDSNSIIANHTIAISSLKPAHIIHPACECCGDIYVANIGIPKDSYAYVKNSMYTLSEQELTSLIPQRSENTSKGDFGHLLIIAGSKNMPGAAVLSTKAALRSGVGLVTVAFPEGIYPVMTTQLTESIFLPLEQNEIGAISSKSIERIKDTFSKYSAILIGPGLTVCDDTRTLVKEIISSSEIPVILDADAINIVSEDLSVLSSAKAPLIITPHPKEFSRLISTPVPTIQSDRRKFAKDFSSIHNIYTVLKGSNTIVACPNSESVYINATGSSGLAKGGSGDVLAGIISALVAQKIGIASAVVAGVFVHGLAGDKVAEKLSKMGMLPSDIINELSRIWQGLD